jgi:hypothetical protein
MSGTPQQHSDEDTAPDDEDSDTSAALSQEGDGDSAIETSGLNGNGKYADGFSDAGESEVSSHIYQLECESHSLQLISFL